MDTKDSLMDKIWRFHAPCFDLEPGQRCQLCYQIELHRIINELDSSNYFSAFGLYTARRSKHKVVWRCEAMKTVADRIGGKIRQAYESYMNLQQWYENCTNYTLYSCVADTVDFNWGDRHVPYDEESDITLASLVPEYHTGCYSINTCYTCYHITVSKTVRALRLSNFKTAFHAFMVSPLWAKRAYELVARALGAETSAALRAYQNLEKIFSHEGFSDHYLREKQNVYGLYGNVNRSLFPGAINYHDGDEREHELIAARRLLENLCV